MTDGICSFAEQITGVRTFESGHVDRVGFCDHTADGYLSTLRDPSFYNGAGVSTHFAIGRDGAILQFVNIFDTAWAQGALGPVQTWPPFASMGKRNPNGYLISTEHEDHEMVNGVSTAIPGSEWTPAQYASDLRVKRWCRDEVKRVMGVDVLRFGLDSLAGHHMFDGVNRAECPGRFWRDVYRSQLYSAILGEGAPAGGDIMNEPAEHYPNELNNARALKAFVLNLETTTPIAFNEDHSGVTFTDLQGNVIGQCKLVSLPDYDMPT